MSETTQTKGEVTFLKNGTKSLPKLTSIGSTGLVWTLWMSEMIPSKAPVLIFVKISDVNLGSDLDPF